MAARRTASDSGDRQLSLIERARRDQLIQITIDLVAEHGYAAASLTRIAQTAGITKGAVLYHFASKDAVVAAAHERVLGELVAAVGAAVDMVPADQAPAAYVRRMVGHLAERPDRMRVIMGAVIIGDIPDAPARWNPLASLLHDARQARGLPPGPDLRTLAVITGGAIDGIMGAHMQDGDFDARDAAETLIAMLETALFA
ncbi:MULTISPECIES: TetR/AcrR family transcriptional regulator [unclassified Nonomuraea]|uniref:TetR/AcrR family transcriptional regulator n=1 Tax=unclassified Nonomuraea TaxID=2593643 RepID=UPI00340DA0DC